MTRKQIAADRKFAKQVGVNRLLSYNSDPKTIKSNQSGKGYLTAILYLAPAKLSGYQVCASATTGCIGGCLHSAGNPVYFQAKQKARIARTRFFFEHRETFQTLLTVEIRAFIKKCEKAGLKPAIRLNGTSDIVWEKVCPWIFEEFPEVHFYDYTKHVKRFAANWQLPANYDLTLSRSEDNEIEVLGVLDANPTAKVSVVFSTGRTKALPSIWAGYIVGDADKDDLRFLDTARIAGLRAKGKARQDVSGFVVQV